MIFNEDSDLLAWAHASLDVTAEVVATLDQPPLCGVEVASVRTRIDPVHDHDRGPPAETADGP